MICPHCKKPLPAKTPVETDIICRLASIEGFLKGLTDGLNMRLESIESQLKFKINKGSEPEGK